jgi:hypothetical protein
LCTQLPWTVVCSEISPWMWKIIAREA